MNKDKPKLKLINNKGTKGYTISNIQEVLDAERFAEFEKWIYGQTIMRYKSEDLIYQDDFIRFLKGLSALD